MSLNFESRAQRVRVVKTIFGLVCAPLIVESLWPSDYFGPSAVALKAVDGGGCFSYGEQLVIQLAIDVWDTEGRCDFGRFLTELDARTIRAVGGFLIACESPQGIEAWLKIWEK